LEETHIKLQWYNIFPSLFFFFLILQFNFFPLRLRHQTSANKLRYLRSSAFYRQPSMIMMTKLILSMICEKRQDACWCTTANIYWNLPEVTLRSCLCDRFKWTSSFFVAGRIAGLWHEVLFWLARAAVSLVT